MVNARVIIAIVIIIILLVIAILGFLIWKNRKTIYSWFLCECCFKESHSPPESLESIQIPIKIVHPSDPPLFNNNTNRSSSFDTNTRQNYPSAPPPPYTVYPQSSY